MFNGVNDIITGGNGNDTLQGNGGADTFKYHFKTAGNDTILDVTNHCLNRVISFFLLMNSVYKYTKGDILF